MDPYLTDLSFEKTTFDGGYVTAGSGEPTPEETPPPSETPPPLPTTAHRVESPPPLPGRRPGDPGIKCPPTLGGLDSISQRDSPNSSYSRVLNTSDPMTSGYMSSDPMTSGYMTMSAGEAYTRGVTPGPTDSATYASISRPRSRQERRSPDFPLRFEDPLPDARDGGRRHSRQMLPDENYLVDDYLRGRGTDPSPSLGR